MARHRHRRRHIGRTGVGVPVLKISAAGREISNGAVVRAHPRGYTRGCAHALRVHIHVCADIHCRLIGGRDACFVATASAWQSFCRRQQGRVRGFRDQSAEDGFGKIEFGFLEAAGRQAGRQAAASPRPAGSREPRATSNARPAASSQRQMATAAMAPMAAIAAGDAEVRRTLRVQPVVAEHGRRNKTGAHGHGIQPWLYLGIADGMSIARVRACRYSK